MQTTVAPYSAQLGKIRSLGPFGPKDEVRQALRPLNDGDWMMQAMMVETGETAEYRLTRALQDPEAR